MTSIGDSMQGFATDGVMAPGGPELVLKFLGSFHPGAEPKNDEIDLSKTCTTTFAEAAS